MRDRYAELLVELREHNHRYHVLDTPIISDAAYDELYRELTQIEADHPELISMESPTTRVGGPVAEVFAAVQHRERMFSLDNAMNIDEFDAWY